MRGQASITKVHLAKSEEDFIILVESAAAVKKWKSDKTTPLADVVAGFKVFTTNKQGAQGVLDTAGKGLLENSFGTSNEDAVIAEILEKGSVQEGEGDVRQGIKNESQGTFSGHSSGPMGGH